MFEGFPKELPDFLWGLALNNERPWFEEHRAEYEQYLQTPFKELAFEVHDRMEEKYPGAAPALHISRIQRDARRLFGRGPYKDHLWFTLAKTSGLYDVQPCLWFEISAVKCGWGLGFWMGAGGAAEKWRQHIDANPARMERLVRAFGRQDVFTLGGEEYKRPKGDPGKLIAPWYNRRGIDLTHTEWFEPSPPGREIADGIVRDFGLILPLYRYMCEII